MKILQIFKTYFPDTMGGVEQVIKTIALETQKQGVQHTLLTLSDTPRRDAVEGLEVIRLRRDFEIASCPFSLQFFSQFKQIARDFDVLHFHYPWPFADFTDLLRRIDQPSMVTFHADALKHSGLRKLYLPFQKAFFKKVDLIVPTSIPLLETSPDLKAYRDKCHVIPLAINADSYAAPDPAHLSLWKDKVGSGFALFVGVLRHYKGLFTLLEAAKKVSIPIVIAGSGPLEADLKSHIAAAGLKNVFLLGRISEADKIALYHLCGMVILPSTARAEAFGVTLIEGLMYQKPLISTELGTGTSYVNQHNKTGLVIEPENVAQLVSAMETLQNPVLAQKMGEAGRAWFLAEFQSAIMGQRYRELYQGLVKP